MRYLNFTAHLNLRAEVKSEWSYNPAAPVCRHDVGRVSFTFLPYEMWMLFFMRYLISLPPPIIYTSSFFLYFFLYFCLPASLPFLLLSCQDGPDDGSDPNCLILIVIRLPTDATLYFVYLFLYFTLHVSGCHKPIIRGVSSCFFIYNHLVHAVLMLLICVCLWTGLSWWFHCTVGLWEPETCRVK